MIFVPLMSPCLCGEISKLQGLHLRPPHFLDTAFPSRETFLIARTFMQQPYSLFEGLGGQAAAPAAAREPEVDDSLASMAARDLDTTLQLLAERAKFITGSSGAAIALLEGEAMTCKASAGPSAPVVGTQLQMQSGLTAESVRLKKSLQCDDAERDLRVNRESCRALGVQSVMVSPLLREGQVIGVFELLAERTYAFEERDVIAMNRLAEAVLTALDQSEAAKRAPLEIAEAKNPAELVLVPSPPIDADQKEEEQQPELTLVQKASLEDVIAPTASPLANVKRCQDCGFPVSEGRTYCVDCEQLRQADEAELPDAPQPEFMATLAAPREESWFDRHMYTIGTIVMVALTVLALYLKFR